MSPVIKMRRPGPPLSSPACKVSPKSFSESFRKIYNLKIKFNLSSKNIIFNYLKFKTQQ